MRITKEKMDQIQDHILEKWPAPRKCPVCQECPDHWRISETPVLLPLLTGSDRISVDRFVEAVKHVAFAPAIALTCSECGHIMLFSAAHLDIVDTEMKPDTFRYTIPPQ